MHRWTSNRRLWLAAAAMLAVGSWAVAETLTVQTRTATVRSRPSALGKKLGSLGEGDVVNATEKKGSWQKVKPVEPSKPAGWVHGSALTSKKLKSKAGVSATVAANSKEATLASRGLDEEVEGQYRASKPQLNAAFRTLDRMNKRPLVTDEQIRKFFSEGGIEPGGGS